jgi:hypothetical protein
MGTLVFNTTMKDAVAAGALVVLVIVSQNLLLKFRGRLILKRKGKNERKASCA